MPRFASGFISFLALQGFKTYAIGNMPKGGALSGMSWIDVYISIAGLLMVLSVGETVLTQFVYENVSRTVADILDSSARIAFPSAYFSIVIVLCLPLSSWTHL